VAEENQHGLLKYFDERFGEMGGVLHLWIQLNYNQ